MCSSIKQAMTYSRYYDHVNRMVLSRRYSDFDPALRTWKVITRDIPKTLGGTGSDVIYPEHADVAIIGGGYLGSAVAYWLKTRAVHGLRVAVLEKDLTYQKMQRNISLGCLTQHFSLIENIKLAQFSAEFLRNAKSNLSKDVNLQYHPTGSLILASEKYAERLEHNVTILKEEGQRLDILSPEQIRSNYPWIDTNDVHLGCVHYESEGTFNASELLRGYMHKSIELGAEYCQAEVIGFELERQTDVLMEGVKPGTYKRLNKVVYKTADGEEKTLKFAICVLAAGDESANIAKMANIGQGEDLLSFKLPVERREHQVYSIEDKATELGLRIPIINDTSGIWLRRNGLDSKLLFGMAPLLDPSSVVDEDDYYRNIVLASLMNRIPSCENNEIKLNHVETYDYNKFDESGLLGQHPYYNNLFLVTGFGKLACPLSPGIGRAISELIIDSHFKTIDFTRFGFDRILMGEPIVEFNVY